MASMGTRGGDGGRVAGTGMGTETWLWGRGGDGDMVVETGTKYFTVSFSSCNPIAISRVRGLGAQ